ncbi:MAG: MoxR family ATPase [Flavobacteriales bacterium]|nr:MoxR family ATPase [Flavobacteriales bacterium]
MSDVEVVKKLVEKYQLLRVEIAKIIVGQDKAVETILISILAGGHSLLVGVPGLAKTLLINTVSQALDLKFNRIQFTPDLMPSDIIGTEILDENRAFKFVKGPVFANVILADEINRTPPKTQAALLEAMQEKSVTAAGNHFTLDSPFFVLATQNPIEQEGTYPLPEAQLDRFMFSIFLDYPSYDEEVEIVKRTTSENVETVKTIISKAEILVFQKIIRKVPVVDNVIEYAVNLVAKTRPKSDKPPEIVNRYLDWGAGPRASQNLILAAKVNSLLNKKFSPDIEDVKAVAHSILRHRIVLNYKAEAEGVTPERIIAELL